MSDEQEESLGLATVEPEGYLQPKRYKTTCRCNACGHVYSWISKAPPKHDKPCPRPECSQVALLQAQLREQANLIRMLQEQRPPAHIGEKTIVKAIDTTAEVVMKDYGLTDLKDNIRHGDSMAPKLSPHQQRAADSYFGGSDTSVVLSPSDQKKASLRRKQLERLGRQAMAGAFPTVNPQELMGGRRGSPILHSVGVEKIQ